MEDSIICSSPGKSSCRPWLSRLKWRSHAPFELCQLSASKVEPPKPLATKERIELKAERSKGQRPEAQRSAHGTRGLQPEPDGQNRDLASFGRPGISPTRPRARWPAAVRWQRMAGGVGCEALISLPAGETQLRWYFGYRVVSRQRRLWVNLANSLYRQSFGRRADTSGNS